MCCELFWGRGLLHLKVGGMKGKMGGRLSRTDRLGREIRRNRSAIGRCGQQHGRVGRQQRMDSGGRQLLIEWILF